MGCSGGFAACSDRVADQGSDAGDGVLAVLLIVPELIYVHVVNIWHWKERYRGKHSDLWGAIILLETTGWMKIVYTLRHLLPDMLQVGRDRRIVELSQQISEESLR